MCISSSQVPAADRDQTAPRDTHEEDQFGLEDGRPATYQGDEPSNAEHTDEPDLPARTNLLANGKSCQSPQMESKAHCISKSQTAVVLCW